MACLADAAQTGDQHRRLESIIAEHTGQELERVRKDMGRDYYMSAEEALAYGIVDSVIASR
jgi:ATP-dependent Clp protease protease subunit